MDKKAIIKSLRINYFVSIAAALVVLLAFELGLIQKGALLAAIPSTAIYIIEVATVMITVLLIPFAIKGFTDSLNKAKGMQEDEFIRLFSKKSLQRIFLLFIVIIVNEFTYYGLNYNGALYCGLLGLGSMIYSFPTRIVLEQFLQKEK